MRPAGHRGAAFPKITGETAGDELAAFFAPWAWLGDEGAADDLASDMSVYHQVRDIGAMRAATLARLSLRIAVYGGAVGARYGHAARSAPQPAAQPSPPPEPRRRPPGQPASAETLSRLLAPLPGSRSAWGRVLQVPGKPKDDGEPAGG